MSASSVRPTPAGLARTLKAFHVLPTAMIVIATGQFIEILPSVAEHDSQPSLKSGTELARK